MARRGALALLDQAAASGTNFASSIIIGRAVAKEQFGAYGLGFTIVVLALNLQTALIAAPYTVYVPRLKDRDQAAYTASTLLHQLLMAAACGVLLLLGGAALSLGAGPRQYAPVAWALAAAVPMVLLRTYARAVCFARLKVNWALAVDVAVAALQLGGLLALMRAGLLSASHAFLVAGGACGLTGLAWLAYARGLFAVERGRAGQDFRRNWALGKWVLGSTAARWGSSGLYPWFLAFFWGTATTGVFSACVAVAMFAAPFLTAMANVLNPAAAHAAADAGRSRLKDVVVRGTAVLAAVMAGFLLIMVLWGGRLVSLLYGTEYGGHGAVVAILALGFAVHSSVLPVDAGLLALERPDAITKSHICGAAATILIGTPLVWRYGLVGAAAGDLVKSAVTTGVRLYAFWSGQRRWPAKPQ